MIFEFEGLLCFQIWKCLLNDFLNKYFKGFSEANFFGAKFRLPESHSFLDLVNFCSDFIPLFATISGPLTDLLQGEDRSSQKLIKWSEEADKSFKVLKQKIAEVTFISWSKTTLKNFPDYHKFFNFLPLK